MSDMRNVNQYVLDPSLLVDLCRDVVEQLGVSTNDSDAGEREIQLSEISKTIERLQKLGISVPDALRAEKLRLACSSEMTEEVAVALEPLVSGLWDILGRIRARLQRRYVNTSDTSNEPLQNGAEHIPPSENQTDVLMFVTSPRDARRRTGLNQSAFWSRFGVGQSGGSRYESGRDIAGPTQILMMLHASGKINDDDLFEIRMALGSTYKQSSE